MAYRHRVMYTCTYSRGRFELDQTSEITASWLELAEAHDSPLEVALRGSPLSSPRSLRTSGSMDGSISPGNLRSSQQKVTDFADAPEVSREAIRAAVRGARKGEAVRLRPTLWWVYCSRAKQCASGASASAPSSGMRGETASQSSSSVAA